MAYCIMYILITETGEYRGIKLPMFSGLIGSFGYSFYFSTGSPSNLKMTKKTAIQTKTNLKAQESRIFVVGHIHF